MSSFSISGLTLGHSSAHRGAQICIPTVRHSVSQGSKGTGSGPIRHSIRGGTLLLPVRPESVGNLTGIHCDLVTFGLAVSRHILIQSLPNFRDILAHVHSRQCADTSRFTGPFLENRCVVSVSFIRCKDPTGKSFLPISGF